MNELDECPSSSEMIGSLIIAKKTRTPVKKTLILQEFCVLFGISIITYYFNLRKGGVCLDHRANSVVSLILPYKMEFLNIVVMPKKNM